MTQIKKKNNQLVIYKNNLVPIVEKAETLVITNSDDIKVAVELLSELNKYQDKVIEWKEKKTVPLNKLLKDIRAETKPLETFYGTAIESLRDRMSEFQTEQIRLQKEAEAKIAAKVSSGYIKIETGVAKLADIVTPDKEISTDKGLVQFREQKILKVTDLSQIPHEYFDLNEKRVLDALKAGTVVAGAEIEVRLVPANFR